MLVSSTVYATDGMRCFEVLSEQDIGFFFLQLPSLEGSSSAQIAEYVVQVVVKILRFAN